MSKIERRIAILIDADNASAQTINPILNHLSAHGRVIVKRAYADWTKDFLKGWRRILNDYAIQPMHQPDYTKGKNASDIALVIDAMDLLYGNQCDSFALITSDSDLTRLATRLKESGKYIYGYGAKKTPEALIHACDEFIYIEDLEEEEQPMMNSEDGDVSIATRPHLSQIRKAIKNACLQQADADGWVDLGHIGNIVKRQYPNFNVKDYKVTSFSNLVRDHFSSHFELGSADGFNQITYIRIKVASKSQRG